METPTQPQNTADRELVMTRTFKAPCELVFRVWTDSEHIHHWWGPTGFINTTKEMEVKPGGIWRFTMHGPDGVDYPNLIQYVEVIKPERLVYLHGSDEDPGQFHVTVTFEEKDYSTKLTMRMVFRSKEERDVVIEKYGALEGNKQTMDRMEKHLLEMEKFDHQIFTSRVFNYPLALVYQAFSDPKHLAKWWGPQGFTNTFHTFNLKSGGEWVFDMQGPDGVVYPNKSLFIEIKPLEKIVFDHVSSHYFRAVFTFEEIEGKTRLSFSMIHSSKEAADKIKVYVIPANEQNFDRLEEELKNMS